MSRRKERKAQYELKRLQESYTSAVLKYGVEHAITNYRRKKLDEFISKR